MNDFLFRSKKRISSLRDLSYFTQVAVHLVISSFSDYREFSTSARHLLVKELRVQRFIRTFFSISFRRVLSTLFSIHPVCIQRMWYNRETTLGIFRDKSFGSLVCFLVKDLFRGGSVSRMEHLIICFDINDHGKVTRSRGNWWRNRTD